eukprot:scaffold1437_cov268-Pinguiococcus_pyrenoidosus.AAC.11
MKVPNWSGGLGGSAFSVWYEIMPSWTPIRPRRRLQGNSDVSSPTGVPARMEASLRSPLAVRHVARIVAVEEAVLLVEQLGQAFPTFPAPERGEDLEEEKHTRSMTPRPDDQKVRRSEDQKIKRSKDQNIPRSEDPKIRRSSRVQRTSVAVTLLPPVNSDGPPRI